MDEHVKECDHFQCKFVVRYDKFLFKDSDGKDIFEDKYQIFASNSTKVLDAS